ncbi:MAG TPA: DUF4926 domain-containing protein [Phormidium sp.]
MIDLYQRVFLNCDLPESNLKKNDTAVLIDYLLHPSGGEMGCVLEVFDENGRTLDVVITLASNISLAKVDF